VAVRTDAAAQNNEGLVILPLLNDGARRQYEARADPGDYPSGPRPALRA
jgi:hypothetical protein